MPTLVFMHSPVAAPSTWEAVARLAEQAGYAVKLPSLTDAIFHPVVGGAPYLTHCAEAIARDARGAARPIFVAHSGAGMLVADTIAHMHDDPVGVVIVDGMMPQPGKAWFDSAAPQLAQRLRALAQDGVTAPWHEWWPPGAVRKLFRSDADYQRFTAQVPRLPLAFFEEVAAPVDVPRGIPCAYLRLSAACDEDAAEALKRGWSVVRREAHHMAMVSDPAAVWSDLETIAVAMAPAKD